MFRSKLIILMLVLLLGTQVAVAAIADESKANIDWRQAANQTINVVMCTHHYTDALRQLIPEFEKLTGITVKLQEYVEGEYFKKILIDFSSGNPVADVFMMNASYVATYATAGWVAPVKPFIDNKKLTDPAWYDFSDFPEGSLKLLRFQGNLYGVPLTVEPQVLFYRKDIFDKLGLSVPQTMDELYKTAMTIKQSKEGIAGIALRMTRGQGTWWPWSGFMATYKATWVDGNRVPHLDTKEAIAATDMYVKLARDAGPSGALNYGWYEVLSAFQQGKTAMILDANSFLGQFEDPDKSAVAGKVGVAVIPEGAPGYRQPAGGTSWSIAVPAATREKDAAWLFVQWATSPKTATRIAVMSGNVARGSIWSNDEFKAEYPYPEWIEASYKSNTMYSSDYFYPQIAEFAEIVDVIDTTLQKIFTGTPTEAAMKEAQAKTLGVLK